MILPILNSYGAYPFLVKHSKVKTDNEPLFFKMLTDTSMYN